MNRRILRDAARAFEDGFCLFELARQILQGLVISGGGAPFVVDFDLLFGMNGKPVEGRKRDARSKGPILGIGSEPAEHSTSAAVRLKAGASRVGVAL